MKAYLSFFKLRFNVALQYRFAAVAGIMTQFFWGIMYVMLYQAYYSAGVEVPMPLNQLVTYIWLQQCLFILTGLVYKDKDIVNTLTTGQVSYELVRPTNLYWFWYSKLSASKIASSALRLLPILIIAFILPAPYGMQLPASLGAFILFIITLSLGFILSTALLMLLYIFMFYTIASKGLFSIYRVVTDFIAGGFMPVSFFPLWLQRIAYILPFRLVKDLPFRVYVGDIGTKDAIASVCVQFVWIFGTFLVGNLLMKNAIKRVEIQGG